MIANQFLKGRVAMVTGGTKGIGKAIALAFASAGADIAIGSRTAATSPCKAKLEALGVRVVAVNVDVRSTDDVQNFYETVVNAFGKVDILATSAGIFPSHTMCDHPDELWQRVMDINLNGVYRTIKSCLPGMIERKWGRIINIGSTVASFAEPELGAYCASKAAVVALSRSVALEGAAHGVTCNVISPDWVETPGAHIKFEKLSLAEGKSTAEYIEQVKEENPQKRIIQPEEVAALALFLCRDEAKAITMQDLMISGGRQG